MITTAKLSADTLDVVQHAEITAEAVSAARVLITEHEVVSATAADAAVPSPTTRRWAALWMLRTSTADSQPARRHYPRRYTYLENALMSREMGRL